jgi:hypothetical protein
VYIYTYIHIHIDIYIYTCSSLGNEFKAVSFLHKIIHKYIHTYIYINMCIHIHPYTHVNPICIRTHKHMIYLFITGQYIQSCLIFCIKLYEYRYTSLHVNPIVHVYTHIYIYIYICIYIYLYTFSSLGNEFHCVSFLH